MKSDIQGKKLKAYFAMTVTKQNPTVLIILEVVICACQTHFFIIITAIAQGNLAVMVVRDIPS